MKILYTRQPIKHVCTCKSYCSLNDTIIVSKLTFTVHTSLRYVESVDVNRSCLFYKQTEDKVRQNFPHVVRKFLALSSKGVTLAGSVTSVT